MWNLFIYGEKFADTQAVCQQLSQETGFTPVTDKEVVELAGRRYSIGYEKLSKALFQKSTPFESFTHAKQRAIAYLKSVLAENFGQKSSIYMGFSGHLLPINFPQVYRVFITADTSYRIQKAFIGNQLPERKAMKAIHREDEKAFRWCRRVYNNRSWDARTYHMVLPTDVLDRDYAVQMALNGFREYMQQPPTGIEQALEDFQLAAKVEVNLAEKGYPVTVGAENGKVVVAVDKPILFLRKFSDKLADEIRDIAGVREVRVEAGPNFNQADLCCPTTFEISLRTQLSRFEDRHAQLRQEAISRLPAKIRQAGRRPLQSSLHLGTMG